MSNFDLLQAKNWAKELLQTEFVILDTETTGLGDEAEIVEIAIIDERGRVLLDERIKPTVAIEAGAFACHGIGLSDLRAAPSFSQVYPKIKQCLQDRQLVIYNASFDLWSLSYCRTKHGLEPYEPDRIHCAMGWYSQYVGDWNDYYGNYKWQRLPNGDHSALGDCMAVLKLIKMMAED